MRLDKFLCDAGIGSRKDIKKLIKSGEVRVEGRNSVRPEDHINPENDKVFFKNALVSYKEFIYLMMNKPQGYISATFDKRLPTVIDLVPEEFLHYDLFPAGRLDIDTEGLLLLTNDGELANLLMHPRHEVNKTYKVTVTGYSQEGLQKLKLPVTLDGYTIKPPIVQVIRRPASPGEKAVLKVTIHEGRNRQVRRTCAMAGMEVTRLIRIQEGSLNLGDLPSGKWRFLTDVEVEELQK